MADQKIKTALNFLNEGTIINLPDGIDPQDAATVAQVTGVSPTTTETAGETISSGKVVFSLVGKMYNFDPANTAIYGRAFGISKTSALVDQPIEVQWSGKFYESGLGLTQDEFYFAGVSGLPTLDVTGFDLIQPIGFAIDSDTLMINFTTALLTT